MLCRLLCDDVWMHGLYHLEILPGGQAEQARPRPSKSGKKGEGSANDDALDLDATQAVVRQLNVNDLKALQRALEDVNICVCFPDMFLQPATSAVLSIFAVLLSRLLLSARCPVVCCRGSCWRSA